MQNVNCDKAEAYLKSLIPHFPEGSVAMGYNGDKYALHLIIDAGMFANGRTGTCYSIPVTCQYRKIRGMRTIVWVIDWIDNPVKFDAKTTADKYGTNIEKLKLLHKRAIEFHKNNAEKVALQDLHRRMIKNFFASKFNEKYVIKNIIAGDALGTVFLYTLELDGQNKYPDMVFHISINGNKLTANLKYISSTETFNNPEIIAEIRAFEDGMKNEMKNIVDRYRDMIFAKINPFK